ncbi:S-adenosyl-L-methionine-dependent methyltransferase [Aspergillus similis]
MIKEEATDGFAANRFTTLFAGPNASGAVNYIFDIIRPIASAIPGFLSERNNNPITSPHDTVFQKTFNTKLGGFEWITQHPEHYGNLFRFLALRPNRDWVDAFPIEAEIGSFNNDSHAEKVLLVDVGGGTGTQSAIFRKKLPHIKGRVIVQEIAEALIHVDAKAPDGIEFMEYDCFTPQPIMGAKFYYLRYVMHLWQDDKCVEALKMIISAMGPESRTIIDEVVIPACGVPWQAATQSILLTTALAGTERTLPQWEKLLEAAGLKILNIFTYDLNMQSVIIAVPRTKDVK